MTLWEEFNHETRASVNPPPGAVNRITSFEAWIAKQQDEGREINEDDLQLAARDAGLSEVQVQEFLESCATWF